MSITTDDLVRIAILPRSQKDKERLELTVRSFAEGNPSPSVWIDNETGFAIAKGASEADVDAKVDIIRRMYGIDCEVRPPQVISRKTIARTAEVDYAHKKHIGGTGEFARVKLLIAPNEPGDGFEFTSQIINGAVPNEYIPAIERGVKAAIGRDEVDGIPLDLKVQLTDGAFHDLDSSAAAFEIASSRAILEAFRLSGFVWMEPIMKIEIITPRDCTGMVIEDLKSRRGSILEKIAFADTAAVHAMVPLANMFGYDSELSTMSKGGAVCTMRFDHYERVPAEDPDPPFPPAAAIRLASD